MKIALIDVDGHNFPNLPLMKLSAYHKARGDHVELNFPMGEYDIAYLSKVFTASKDFETILNAEQIITGGTGYDIKNKLPQEIESIFPDYSLYGIKNTAYGFLTRGCPRQCKFCIVSEKEGCISQKVSDLRQFWDGQKEIKLLDPNLLASPDKIELLDQLINSKAWVDFTQGLDIRLMTDECIEKFKRIKTKMIHFAWDGEKDSNAIIKNLMHFKQATNIDYRKATVYILVNFDTDFEFDLERIYKVREIGYTPFVMVYDRDNANRKYHQLQRWVLNKTIFRSGNADTFEAYQNYEKTLPEFYFETINFLDGVI